MLTVSGDLWLAGWMGRWARTLGQYMGVVENPGGEPGEEELGDKPLMWLKDGEFPGREKPGER